MKFDSFSHLDDDARALVSILCSGGDERMDLDSRGLNKYLCAPWPRNVIHFGSCTGSQISERGWAAARAAHETFRVRAAEVGVADALQEMGDAIHDDLLHQLKLSDLPDAEVVFTPSGSDAESVILGLIGLVEPGPIENIVVGAREVGSGTLEAAGGHYYSHHVAGRAQLTPGDPIDPALSARTRVRQVLLRHGRAAEREPEEIDAEIDAMVREAVGQGSRTLVHVVAHSKTGLHAPRLETVNRFRREYGDRVIGVIDAAQGRVSRRGLRDYLERGFVVILTGSKFYGGPAFSGAVLVPAWLSKAVAALPETAPFMPDYLTCAQVPAAWPALRASLPAATEPVGTAAGNLGLLLRWQSALAEMRAYYAVPSADRYRILRAFESEVPQRLGRHPCLELITKVTPVLDNKAERLLQSKTTVFSFRIYGLDGSQHAQRQVANWVRWLHADLSGYLDGAASESQRRAAASSFQIGQSVDVSGLDYTPHDYVFRVALGGVLITDVATDTRLGTTLDARLDWLLTCIDQLADKIQFLSEFEDRLPEPALA